MNQDACSYGAGFLLKCVGEPERGVLLRLPMGLMERELTLSTYDSSMKKGGTHVCVRKPLVRWCSRSSLRVKSGFEAESKAGNAYSMPLVKVCIEAARLRPLKLMVGRGKRRGERRL